MPLNIELLYTADCASWETAADLLQQALSDLSLEADIQYYLIETDRQAIDAFFIGSPTIRIDGYDLFPVEGATSGLKLRSYYTEEGMLDYPTYNMLLNALQHYAA